METDNPGSGQAAAVQEMTEHEAWYHGVCERMRQLLLDFGYSHPIVDDMVNYRSWQVIYMIVRDWHDLAGDDSPAELKVRAAAIMKEMQAFASFTVEYFTPAKCLLETIRRDAD